MSLVTFIYIYIYILTFPKHPDHYISDPSNERRHCREHFHIKKWLWGKPRFHVKCPGKPLHKNVTF